MKTPLPPGSVQPSRLAPLAFRRFGIVLLFLISAIARAVNVPTLTPDGGTFTTFQSVTVACTTPDALIRYTTDGSDPTSTTGTAIAPGGTIQILGPLTLKAKAFLNAEVSAVKTAAYKITGHVSTSGSHTLVLRADGTVWATGLNSSGQLGDGTTINRIVLTQVPGLSDVVAVAAGGSHSLALMRDGTVKAWGANTNSQCGAAGLTPHPVSGLANVTTIAAGLTHSVARTSVSGGSVYTWGGGANGQQGNGSTSDRATPGLVLAGVKDIASGGAGNHTLALMNGGTVKCWGSNSNGQCGGSPSYSPVAAPVDAYSVAGIAAIAAGTDHSLALTTSGTVYGWGGTLSYNYSQPALIPNLTNIRSVAAGYGFTLAVKTDNSVLGLGSNYYGGLGIGAVPSAASPVALTIPTSVAVLAAGGNSTVAIQSNGNVFAWGSNSSGALGFGTATQKNVPIELLSENLVEVSSVAAGGNHNLITHADPINHANDTVLAWGSNGSGQLGAGNTLPYAEPHLITGVTPLFNTVSTAAGVDFSLVLRGNGTVVAAGQNSYGVLGLSSNGARSTTFIPVGGLPPLVSIAAGRWHALAIGDASVSGQVYAWGLGSNGQLGNGATTFSRYVPVPVSTLTNVSTVAAGQYHSVARKTEGTVWAWGSNSYGQIGDSTTTQRSAPVQIPSLSGSLAIASGLNHNLAVTINHTVAVWGYNANGQLGDNTTTNRTTPIILPTLSNVVQVAAGYGHSLALKDDGTVWAWGRNVEGQLGDATNIQRNAPVQVLGLSGIVAIAAGDYHNLARKADGGVASWGANNLDQLGTGLSTAQLNPLIVPGINVLHGVAEVTIQQPVPDTYAVGEPFTLQLTLNPAAGRSIANLAYFSDGFPLALAGAPVTYLENIYPSVTTPTARLAELSSDTWGDLHITATAYDEDHTPSFPSQPVTVRIFPPITVTATPALGNSVRLLWSVILPNIATTYQLERRLSGEASAVVLQSALSGPTYLDAALALNQEYLYRVTGFKNGLRTAMSAEVAVVILDSDGDGLPDWWEQAWNLNLHSAADATAAIGGLGLTAGKMYASQAMPGGGGPPLASEWVLRLPLWQTSEYDSLANTLGSHLTWDGEITPGATVTIERERLYNQWIAVRTVAADTKYAYVADPDGEDPLFWEHVWSGAGRPRSERPNFRLRGAYTSNESVSRVRVMVRSSEVIRGQPGVQEFSGSWFSDPSTPPARKYYLKSHISVSDYTFWHFENHSTWGYGNSETDYTVNPVIFFGHSKSEGYFMSQENWDNGSGSGSYSKTHSESDATWPEPVSQSPVTGSGFDSTSSSTDSWGWDSEDSWSDNTGDWTSGSGTSIYLPGPGATSGPPISEIWRFDWTGISSSKASPDPTPGWAASPTSIGASGTPTSPQTARWSGNGRTVATTLEEEYPAAEFFANTRKLLLPAPGSPGAIFMPDAGLGSRTMSLYHGEMPARGSGMEYHVGDSPSWGALHTLETTKCFWTANLGQLTLKKSDWWLEANDCLASEVVSVVETEEGYSSFGQATDGQKVIKAILSITPGSKPGEKVTTGTISSDVTTTMINLVRYLARLPAFIRVDANRDGVIDENDITSKERPYRFWLNNDYDKGGTVDGGDWEEDDYKESSGPDHDRMNNVIECRRDLEDLTRLWITFKGITEMIKIGGVTLELEWKPMDGGTFGSAADGTPGVRVFRAFEPDGGRLYLEDDGTGYNQIQSPYNTGYCEAKAGSPVALPLSQVSLTNLTESNPVIHLLFEGTSAGKGKLILNLKKGGQKIGEYPPLYMELKDVKDMYERWSVGDVAQHDIQENVWPGAMQPLYGPGPPSKAMVPPPDETNDYILFVHGWNMSPFDKDWFSDTAFKRLWHQGYKGRFGAFRWPTFYFDRGLFGVPLPVPDNWETPERTHFDASEHRAWASAPGLLGLLGQLNGGKFHGKVRMMAHSMGNVVAGEALRQAGGNVAHTYVASQAALSAHCYDAAAPLMPYYGQPKTTPNVYGYHWQPGVTSFPDQWQAENRPCYMHANYMQGKATQYVSYYNDEDWALRWPRWQATQQSKPNIHYDYLYTTTSRGFIYRPWNPFNNRNLTFPADRHEIFSWAAESHSWALGAQWVGGVVGKNLNLKTEFSYNDAHKFHSGQFRGTNMERGKYWSQLLKDFGLKELAP